jgi:DNA-binding MarR family transcriptional regulator
LSRSSRQRPRARIASAAAPAEQGARTPRPEAIRATAALRAALRSFEHASDRIAREHGLTPRRYLLLLMIKGAPDGSERSTVSELAELLKLEQHTVTELVGRAERAGLLARERSARDARVVHLRLTDEGDASVAAIFREHERERRALMRALRSGSTPPPSD